ncbi:MAG: outer membrane lipoprotein-sorting protein, partial [Halocynthiibacter sp.]
MRRKFMPLLAALFLAVFPAVVLAQNATEIMAGVDARDDGDNATSEIEMVLIDKNGNKRSRTLQSFTKDRANDTQRLMFFLAPADVRGTGFLTYDFGAANRDDDKWIYLPELFKTKRIATSD